MGQQLNCEKTSLYFSRNTPQDIQEDIKDQFGEDIIRQYEKYLGLPSLVGKNKLKQHLWSVDRLDNTLSRWNDKLLSNAGKEILVKIVA